MRSLDFSINLIIQPHYDPDNRNEYQESSWEVKGGRRVRLTTLQPSVSRLFRNMWEPRRLTTLWAFTACYRDSFTFFNLTEGRIRDNGISIATSYELDDRGVTIWVPMRSRIFSTSSRPALGFTQPPIQWTRGGYFPRVKAGGAWSSPLTSN
jgi:hypothetical protein